MMEERRVCWAAVSVGRGAKRPWGEAEEKKEEAYFRARPMSVGEERVTVSREESGGRLGRWIAVMMVGAFGTLAREWK